MLTNVCICGLIVGVALVLRRSAGECLNSGKVYANHTVWLPDPCLLCTCHDRVSICEPVGCIDPKCNFHQGEYLNLPPNECCPRCAKILSPCDYKGQKVPHNTKWSPDFCVNCYCWNGVVICSNTTCSQVQCKSGQISRSLPGQCCPKCVPAGELCSYGDHRYQDGTEWEPLPCTKCICRDGQSSCYAIQCPALICPQGQRHERTMQGCCTRCVSSQCIEDGQKYQEGVQWKRDACTTCGCISGKVVCERKLCPQSLSCAPREIEVLRSGNCCPECVPRNAPCTMELPKRYSGDIWNISTCGFCFCEDGRVQCHTAHCGQAVCKEFEVLVHLDGKCCPECILKPRCNFSGISYEDGQTWHPDACSVCNCKKGEVICYQKNCPICPASSRPVRMTSECCGQCKPIDCPQECGECASDGHCSTCEDKRKFVYGGGGRGQCVDSCPPGHYSSKANVCRTCHKSCLTCVEETDHHCSSCKPSTYLQHGKCVARCALGHYFFNRQCLRCHSSCSSCTGKERDMCTACELNFQVVKFGRCVDNCGPKYYSNAGICHACPRNCRVCAGRGKTCAACETGYILHAGQCLAACPNGFYVNTGVCFACHPSCFSCTGGSKDECRSCHGGAMVMNGHCMMPCPPGQYIQPDGNCRDCEAGCRSCHISADSHTPICFDCSNPKKYPSGHQCLYTCGPGKYLQDNICRGCGPSCLACSDPASCTRCRLPLLLSDGLCLLECGPGKYAGADAVCKECGSGCIQCSNKETCTACIRGMYLKNDVCVRTCGYGYFVDRLNRKCEENTFAPVLQVVGQVHLTDGLVLTSLQDVIYLTDPDTADEKLEIYLIKPPNNGRLVRIVDTIDQVLHQEESFTWTDLKAGKVYYSPHSHTQSKDSIVLKASDRQLFSKAEEVEIVAVSQGSLYLVKNKDLLAHTGETTPIKPSVLNFTSATSGNVMLNVLEGPHYGQVVYLSHKSPVQSFPLAKLQSDQIGYQHNKSSRSGEKSDMVLIQASDGYNILNVILDIILRSKNSKLPMVLINRVAHVESGGMLQITNNLLKAVSMNKKKTKRDDVIFTLQPPQSNPKEGEIMMIVAVPETGPRRGWKTLGNGQMAFGMLRFLQQDINDGRIWYKHNGGKSKSDMFTFQVADSSTPPNILRDQEFHIAVSGTTDEGSAEILSPDLHYSMTVLENHLSPLKLRFSGADGDDTAYTVTTPLGKNEGSLEHVDRPFQPLTVFTQKEINNKKIIFRPPAGNLHSKERNVGFKFATLNAVNGRRQPEEEYQIRIIPANSTAPKLQNSSLQLVVAKSGTAPVGANVITIHDPDTEMSELTIKIIEEPRHGRLEKYENGRKIRLRKGNEFPYEELMSSSFRYAHSGSNTDDHDSFWIAITDGVHQTTAKVLVKMIAADRAAPILLPTASQKANVSEGGVVKLGNDSLGFTDKEDPPERILITVASSPEKGQLVLKGQLPRLLKKNSSFTQADINSGTLSYATDKEIGSRTIADVLVFNVSDSSHNVLPDQLLTILIMPVNNQPPTVAVKSSLTVKEGSEIAISGDEISITDEDTTVSHLTIVINQPPRFGKLQDTKHVNDERQGALVFSVTDLLQGYVSYVQSDHKGKEEAKDGFQFYVTDGPNISPSKYLNISILLVNDEIPEIVSDHLFVKEGEFITLTNTSIYVIDIDSQPEDIIFTLITAPVYGVLLRKNFLGEPSVALSELREKDTFSYEDVLSGLMLYQHSGEKERSDSFTLIVSDGEFNSTQTMNVVIGLISFETPRLSINRGLRLREGSTKPINSFVLRAVDVDSEDSKIIYTLTEDALDGMLYLNKHGVISTLEADGPVTQFTQDDINKGHVVYKHGTNDKPGNIVFKFRISDPEGNSLIDQSFYITVIEDRFPPSITVNRELVLAEGEQAKITTEYLSAMDIDSDTDRLQYTILSSPKLGHVEQVYQPDVPITQFTQSELAANMIAYVHTSTAETYADKFKFSLSDGKNEIVQMFSLAITPVDDSIPLVTSSGLRVQEGVRKLITEFDLKAVDLDTQEEFIIFHVIRPPVHGSLDVKRTDGVHDAAKMFSMEDIYENRISYQHDGTETLRDSFTFTVNDGTNHLFSLQEEHDTTAPDSRPQTFNIEILPMDDGSPVLETNLGLQFLEYTNFKAFNIISSRELKSSDPDTADTDLVYIITDPPERGHLENLADPGLSINSFTQANINKGIIRYVLTGNVSQGKDHFVFDLKDSKPTIISNNVFHISWSVISFEQPEFNFTETSGVIHIPVVRRGNLKQYTIVTCHTTPGSAVTTKIKTKPGTYDFVEQTGQVQFDEWQDTKSCTIIINDDSIFEGPETFYVELSHPTYALITNPAKATITIHDEEDEPVVQFDQDVYHVNETDGQLLAKLVRTGDLSSLVSVICYTISMTATGSGSSWLESGSDYISRQTSTSNQVVFLPGITEATCDVKIIDDSEYESAEQFELRLKHPSRTAQLGPISEATVVIQGPNDESLIHLSQSEYHFDEDSGVVDIEVMRDGSDLSHSSLVWCATRLTEPLSPPATPGHDYIPSSSQITFGPGERVQRCQLIILDDDVDPRLEGNETLIVFLSSAVGSSLTEPHVSTVVINDTDLDIPMMQFKHSKYHVGEKNGSVDIPITRSGDLNYQSSVICHTQQNTAQVGDDYTERPLSESSRITFYPGEMVKNCTIEIVDDSKFESHEVFFLILTGAQGTMLSKAILGDSDNTTIVITNEDDVPTVQFEKAAYSIAEPSQTASITVTVVRGGDTNQTSSVRCSTRDGSAVSGVDYHPKSLILNFLPGVSSAGFPVDVLYNDDIEWHESFTILLGPEEPEGAVLGTITSTTVTVLDNEVSGSIVLPAPPLVVSLLHYGNVKEGLKTDPTAGYPLICVSPCDPHYPIYSTTKDLCKESQINQSSIHYHWESAMPSEEDSSHPPFVEILDDTLFTNVNGKVLDSIHFRPSFFVRCVAQPFQDNRNLGIPLKSQSVKISHDDSICRSPVYAGNPYGYQAQSFLANLEYIQASSSNHPNTIHISVTVPHQDGMLPVISTFPLHNVKFLLSDPIYRQQHICSNIITHEERAPIIDQGFLNDEQLDSNHHTPSFSLPFQFDENLRGKQTLLLYKHLNLKSCIWKFDAWYHMTELVDLCGGEILTNFQVQDSGKTFLTVRVPLYASYVYTSAPAGWSSLEHHTEMEFSFFYNTVLWKSGLETEGNLGGRLQVFRILIGEDGRLVIDFQTQAKFRGLFVLKHHTKPGIESQIQPPDDMSVSFDLDILWTEQTFDGPRQLWRATSQYNLKDYTGQYVVELIPCSVKPTQKFLVSQATIPCTAHSPQRFQVPISFQQTNRPVPVQYTLNTRFQLTNNEKLFLMDPKNAEIPVEELDYNGAFSKGQKIYGRVIWSPDQDLKAAYRLSIDKVYLCTGKDGYIPTFDPTGDVSKEGPQYGCIQPNPNLKYRFLILDQENPEAAQKAFNQIKFGARFVRDDPKFSAMRSLAGVDGFVMDVDPLYKVDSGHQWYLQVLYAIGPANRPMRFQRSVRIESAEKSYLTGRNGTNIKHLQLNSTYFGALEVEIVPDDVMIVMLPVACVCLAALTVCCLIVCLGQRRRRKGSKQPKKSNLEIAQQNSVNYERNKCIRDRKINQSVEIKRVNTLVKIKNINELSKNAGKIPGTEV